MLFKEDDGANSVSVKAVNVKFILGPQKCNEQFKEYYTRNSYMLPRGQKTVQVIVLQRVNAINPLLLIVFPFHIRQLHFILKILYLYFVIKNVNNLVSFFFSY